MALLSDRPRAWADERSRYPSHRCRPAVSRCRSHGAAPLGVRLWEMAAEQIEDPESNEGSREAACKQRPHDRPIDGTLTRVQNAGRVSSARCRAGRSRSQGSASHRVPTRSGARIALAPMPERPTKAPTMRSTSEIRGSGVMRRVLSKGVQRKGKTKSPRVGGSLLEHTDFKIRYEVGPNSGGSG